MTELEMEFSKKGFANKMRRIARNDNPETDHMDADELMCDLLCSLGYDEGVEIFKNMMKWYS